MKDIRSTSSRMKYVLIALGIIVVIALLCVTLVHQNSADSLEAPVKAGPTVKTAELELQMTQTELRKVTNSARPQEVFEPFSRPDSSPSAKTGGTGLGLAICKAIADANGWQLDVVASPHEVEATLLVSSSANLA